MRAWSRTLVFCLLFLGPPALTAAELPRAKPEAAGMSAEKLERVDAAVQQLIDQQVTAGVVVAVARHGKLVYLKRYGVMDADKPMKPDTIFRIYSMSKPITTVAAMILYEEGKLDLDDPVARFIPEFKNLKVYEKGGKLAELKRPVTIRDLMRHTSGLTYGFFGNSPVDKMYREKKILDRNETLKQMTEKLATIPLLYQPGARWNYSVSVDVLGRVVEVASGKPLDEFFEERIFKPLDMKDTAFYVPKEKLNRFAAVYGQKKGGGLHITDAPATSNYRTKPKLFSGGGGLVGTTRDYLRFCQMMLNGGELDGHRLLKAESVQMMTEDQLPKEARGTGPGSGFGLGFAVRTVRFGKTGPSVREYGWGGAASTHFWISPTDDLAVVIMQQYMPNMSRLEQALKPIIYQAVTDRGRASR